MYLAKTNGAAIDGYRSLIVDAVCERMELLVNTPHALVKKMSARELIQAGLCDPVRIFVKMEPHNQEKLRQRRVRLISSVSLIDQIVERLLGDRQNMAEIRQWYNIPVKPGMGLDDAGLEILWDEMKPLLSGAAQSDVSGWDWSVDEPMQFSDRDLRCLCASQAEGTWFHNAVSNLTSCVVLSVYMFSDGLLAEQLVAGLQNSGRYWTSSGNSHLRVLQAYKVGAPWAKAMGDDCVEGYVKEAVKRYEMMGFRIKLYERCDSGSFEFCSHKFTGPRWAEPVGWAKTLYRLLNHPVCTPVLVEQFAYEMRHSPFKEKCLELVRDVETSVPKDFTVGLLKNGKQAINQTSSHVLGGQGVGWAQQGSLDC
jgi:hypothetical protein